MTTFKLSNDDKTLTSISDSVNHTKTANYCSSYNVIVHVLPFFSNLSAFALSIITVHIYM